MNELSNYEKLESKKPVIFGIKITWLTVNVRFEQIKRLLKNEKNKLHSDSLHGNPSNGYN